MRNLLVCISVAFLIVALLPAAHAQDMVETSSTIQQLQNGELTSEQALEKEISQGLFNEESSQETLIWGFLNTFIISGCIVTLRLFKNYA